MCNPELDVAHTAVTEMQASHWESFGGSRGLPPAWASTLVLPLLPLGRLPGAHTPSQAGLRTIYACSSSRATGTRGHSFCNGVCEHPWLQTSRKLEATSLPSARHVAAA